LPFPHCGGEAAASPGDAVEITAVEVFPVEGDKLRAYVIITLDHCFVVRDVKVIQGTSGLFVAMPAKRRKDGTFKDIAHPLNADTRAWMEEAVLAAYRRELARRETHDSGGTRVPPAQNEIAPTDTLK
jgi:stage V sporulation protein G